MVMQDELGGCDNKKHESKRSLREFVLSSVRVLLTAVLIAFVLSRFVVLNASVVSGSMEPAIMTGDRVICFRLSYLFNGPQRFDVIAFEGLEVGANWVYVKRIVGLPGERVEIIDGHVYIDSDPTPLTEHFITGPRGGNYGPFYVPPGHYFVLGDNRRFSYDSKNWTDPFLPLERILGRAVFIYFPSIGGVVR